MLSEKGDPAEEAATSLQKSNSAQGESPTPGKEAVSQESNSTKEAQPLGSAASSPEKHNEKSTEEAAATLTARGGQDSEKPDDKQTKSGGERVETADGARQENVEGEEQVEDESKYLKGFQLMTLTAGLAMAVFVISLDNTIIGLLPHAAMFLSHFENTVIDTSLN